MNSSNFNIETEQPRIASILPEHCIYVPAFCLYLQNLVLYPMNQTFVLPDPCVYIRFVYISHGLRVYTIPSRSIRG